MLLNRFEALGLLPPKLEAYKGFKLIFPERFNSIVWRYVEFSSIPMTDVVRLSDELTLQLVYLDRHTYVKHTIFLPKRLKGYYLKIGQSLLVRSDQRKSGAFRRDLQQART